MARNTRKIAFSVNTKVHEKLIAWLDSLSNRSETIRKVLMAHLEDYELNDPKHAEIMAALADLRGRIETLSAKRQSTLADTPLSEFFEVVSETPDFGFDD